MGRQPKETLQEFAERLPSQVTRAQFGFLVGINERNVDLYATRGVLVKAGPNSFDLLPSLLNYTKHMRDAAAGRAGGEGGKNLAQERADLTSIEKQIAQHKLDEMMGKSIPVEEVMDGWVRIATKVKSALLGLSSKIGFVVPHLTAHDRQEIARVCREALTEIAKEVNGGEVHGAYGKEFDDEF